MKQEIPPTIKTIIAHIASLDTNTKLGYVQT